MFDLLKELILDSQENTANTGIPRHLDYELVPGKAFICIGVRRCGKSTLLMQIREKLEKKEVSLENLVSLNFFDDRLDDLKNGNLSLISEAFYTLYPHKKKNETVYFFFDELQEMPNWEKFIERLVRTEKCEIFISGSSAKLLSTEIATQMRGRSLSWELFPFSFAEYLDYHQIDYSRLTSQTRMFLIKYFDNYFESGGFPEVIPMNKKLRILTHQEYFKAILHRDIIERFDANHPQAVIRLGHRLANSISSLHSFNRLTEILKSQGYRVSKAFVNNCLSWFQDAYLFFSVPIFSPSASKQNANPRKIYCIDHALITSVSSKIARNMGMLLENLIFLHLRRKTQEIYYYRTKTSKEVDFLWLDEGRNRHLVQVSYNMEEEESIKREKKALLEAMVELNIQEATIVTHHEDATWKEGDKIIHLIPAWKYCLT